MDPLKIILIVVAMIIMILFILMMIFWKKIFNYRKAFTPSTKIPFSVNDLISILGSINNIEEVRATLTRLKVTVKNLDDVDLTLLKTKFKLKNPEIIKNTIVLPFGNISLKIKNIIDQQKLNN
ncbi:PTS sugar transporter [Spiroplasma sp. DGKH1]|uniref:PTS sugar transporter n=1 Tax=Spiroplasma sp. DGKH1 TaxID=3050074 RepID=UPI0034C696AE